MTQKVDSEQISIEMMSEFGTGVVGIVAAWSYITLSIVFSLRDKLQSVEFALAIRAVEQWGMAVPHMLMSNEMKPWTRSEIPGLRKYFEDTLEVIVLMEAAEPRLVYFHEQRDRNRMYLEEARTFCQDQIEEIDRLSEFGDLTCETWVFENFSFHCRRLIEAVLGDELMEQFKKEYKASLGGIKSAEQLINAPEV